MLRKTFKKISSLMLILWLLSYAAIAWAAQDVWVSDPETQCKICFVIDRSTGCQFGWESTTDDVNLLGARWTGPIVASKADGKGVIKFTLRNSDGNIWIIQGKASMKNGKLNGIAELKWSGYLFDEYTYSGYYLEGCKEGKGILTIDLGRSYDGDWRNDKFNGQGIYLYRDYEDIEGEKYYTGVRQMYCGDWKDNTEEGQGLMRYSDGRIYIGQWKNGVKCGMGVFKWPENAGYQGDIYDGDWKDDNMDGKGVMRYPDGSVMYEGDWKNGKIDGTGIYHWKNGEEYHGDFKVNQREGQGTMKYANGDVYYGEWKIDQRNGQGELKDNGGKTVFKGKWKDDQPVKP